jgi:hypothetical protein
MQRATTMFDDCHIEHRDKLLDIDFARAEKLIAIGMPFDEAVDHLRRLAAGIDAEDRAHEANIEKIAKMADAYIVAGARTVNWDFTTWCYVSGYDASDPDARRMFECLLAYARQEGVRGRR